jgi:ABC-type glycerol-3-phosphate transport system substrate-binding protein
MKKILIIMLAIALAVMAAGCSGGKETQESAAADETQQAEKNNNEEESGTIEMNLKINDEEVNVKWEDNESVRALADLAAKGPVTVETSRYGGFEQVGGLGTTLPSDDVDTVTEPGDIVLYSGSNIVVFFGTNSWAYTRLGHIEGKSRDELNELLGGNTAVLKITL